MAVEGLEGAGAETREVLDFLKLDLIFWVACSTVSDYTVNWRAGLSDGSPLSMLNLILFVSMPIVFIFLMSFSGTLSVTVTLIDWL